MRVRSPTHRPRPGGVAWWRKRGTLAVLGCVAIVACLLWTSSWLAPPAGGSKRSAVAGGHAGARLAPRAAVVGRAGDANGGGVRGPRDGNAGGAVRNGRTAAAPAPSTKPTTQWAPHACSDRPAMAFDRPAALNALVPPGAAPSSSGAAAAGAGTAAPKKGRPRVIHSAKPRLFPPPPDLGAIESEADAELVRDFTVVLSAKDSFSVFPRSVARLREVTPRRLHVIICLPTALAAADTTWLPVVAVDDYVSVMTLGAGVTSPDPYDCKIEAMHLRSGPDGPFLVDTEYVALLMNDVLVDDPQWLAKLHSHLRDEEAEFLAIGIGERGHRIGDEHEHPLESRRFVDKPHNRLVDDGLGVLIVEGADAASGHKWWLTAQYDTKEEGQHRDAQERVQFVEDHAIAASSALLRGTEGVAHRGAHGAPRLGACDFFDVSASKEMFDLFFNYKFVAGEDPHGHHAEHELFYELPFACLEPQDYAYYALRRSDEVNVFDIARESAKWGVQVPQDSYHRVFADEMMAGVAATSLESWRRFTHVDAPTVGEVLRTTIAGHKYARGGEVNLASRPYTDAFYGEARDGEAYGRWHHVRDDAAMQASLVVATLVFAGADRFDLQCSWRQGDATWTTTYAGLDARGIVDVTFAAYDVPPRVDLGSRASPPGAQAQAGAVGPVELVGASITRAEQAMEPLAESLYNDPRFVDDMRSAALRSGEVVRTRSIAGNGFDQIHAWTARNGPLYSPFVMVRCSLQGASEDMREAFIRRGASLILGSLADGVSPDGDASPEAARMREAWLWVRASVADVRAASGRLVAAASRNKCSLVPLLSTPASLPVPADVGMFTDRLPSDMAAEFGVSDVLGAGEVRPVRPVAAADTSRVLLYAYRPLTVDNLVDLLGGE